MCGSSAAIPTADGRDAATSSPRRPRPCAASSSRTPGSKARQKRGGGLARVELVDTAAPDRDDDLLALDEAMTRLAAEDPIAARVVELRQFAGLGHEDVAAELGITVYLARQKWAYARAWLRRSIGD